MKNKLLLIVLAIVAIISIISVTYALYIASATQGNINQIVGGSASCLTVTKVSESSGINLVDAIPVRDSEGIKKTPYTMSISNNCNTEINFVAAMELLNIDGKTTNDYLSSTLLKVKYNDHEPNIYSDLLTYDKILNNSYDAKMIGYGTISANGTKIISVLIWVDENATNDNAMNKYINSKVLIHAGQVPDSLTSTKSTVIASNATITGGMTLNNMINNGGFEGNVDNWNSLTNATITKSNAQKYFGNFSMELTPTDSSLTEATISSGPYNYNSGNIYYTSVMRYSPSASTEIYFPLTEPYPQTNLNASNGWVKDSMIVNNTSIDSGEYYYRLDNNNASSDVATYFDGVTLINLTADFNGTIPTKEWLDQNLIYFDNKGSIKIDNNLNTTRTYIITPEYGYGFDNITGCDNASYNTSNNTLTVSNILDEKICKVNFKLLNRTINTSVVNGQITSASNLTVFVGETATFTVVPNTGYEYSTASCTSGNASYNPETNILTVSNVTNNGTCSVNFTIKSYLVNVSVTNGISDPTSRTIEHGGSGTFTISTNSNYTVTGATISGTGCSLSGSTLTVSNVTGAVICSVTLPLQSYLVNVSVTNGTSSPTSRTIEHGSGGTFTLTPNTGYMLDGATVSTGCSLSEDILSVSNVTSAITCSVSMALAQPSVLVSNYSHLTSTQSFTAEVAGYYKLEAWGAQGIYSNASPSTAFANGYGGYASGVVYLTKNQILYIYVGGKPTTYNGGWNGGGASFQGSSYNDNGPGGGATDFCLVSSTVSLDSYKRYVRTSESYLSRILVAGGGGGGRSNNAASAGGYYNTSGAATAAGTLTSVGGSSGTYNAGGFGYASSGTSTGDDVAGGGGGWYGGGAYGDSYGGGGSSFVWSSTTASSIPTNYSPSVSFQMTSPTYAKGNSSMPSFTTAGGTETGHAGDGNARVTWCNATSPTC